MFLHLTLCNIILAIITGAEGKYDEGVSIELLLRWPRRHQNLIPVDEKLYYGLCKNST